MEKASIAIILHGADGKMGRAIRSVASSIAGVRVESMLVLNKSPAADRPDPDAPPVVRTPPKKNSPGHVVIDFSHARAVAPLIRSLAGSGLPLVSGTTGIGQAEHDLLEEYASETPVFYDENMSYGISVLRQLLRAAGVMLGDTADVEIVEYHHREKADFPSGTAISLARVLRPEGEPIVGRGRSAADAKGVHIHSARMGGIPGDHKVHFATDDEVVTLSHRALSRDVFARGAVRAAQFIVTQERGLYGMGDVAKARLEAWPNG